MSSIASPQDNLAFGRRLSAVRATTGLSQIAFAEQLGLSLRAYADYERGEREAPVALFRALLHQFGIDPIWMLSGEGDTPQKAGARTTDFMQVVGIMEKIDAALALKRRKPTQPQRARILRLLYALAQQHGQITEAEVEHAVSAVVTR